MQLPVKLSGTRLQGARSIAAGVLGVCLLGGCSPSGKNSAAVLGSFTEIPAESGPSTDPQAPQQVQSYAAVESQRPQTPGAGGGLAGLFSAFRGERAPPPEPPPPGEFIAPEQAPLPLSRPDYGDREKVDLAALAREEAAKLALLASQGAGQTAGVGLGTGSSAPERAQALARSLNAFERREAGVPDDEDDDELEIAAQPPAKTPNNSGQANAAPKMAFGYTPAHFEIAGVQPLPLLGAAAQGASVRSSNGLALNAPVQRWRAAYDNVETACFPQQLRNALDNIAAHFNAEVLVTSGARENGRRGSLHRSCKAADIRIVGVAPADVAAYARTVPGLNGVGTYRRVSLTHIDVRDERFAWRW